MATHNAIGGKCPQCGQDADRASNADEGRRAPRHGDLAVCWYCAAHLIYNTEDGWHRLSKNEERTFATDERLDILRLEHAVRKYWFSKGKPLPHNPP